MTVFRTPFFDEFSLLLEIGFASPPDHPEILLGQSSTSTLPKKVYKKPLKPNLKQGGDLWTAVGLAL